MNLCNLHPHFNSNRKQANPKLHPISSNAIPILPSPQYRPSSLSAYTPRDPSSMVNCVIPPEKSLISAQRQPLSRHGIRNNKQMLRR